MGVYSGVDYKRAGLVYLYLAPDDISLRYYLEGSSADCMSDFEKDSEGGLIRCIREFSN
jgi:hypothetical protein